MRCRGGERAGLFINGLINNTNDAVFSYLINRWFFFFLIIYACCASCWGGRASVMIHTGIKELHSVVYRSGQVRVKSRDRSIAKTTSFGF